MVDSDSDFAPGPVVEETKTKKLTKRRGRPPAREAEVFRTVKRSGHQARQKSEEHLVLAWLTIHFGWQLLDQ